MTPPLPTDRSGISAPQLLTRRTFGRLSAAAISSAALLAASTPPASAATVGLRTVTANIKDNREEPAGAELEKFKKGIGIATGRGEVIFLQEIGNEDRKTYLRSLDDWHLTVLGSNGLLVRKARFDKLRTGHRNFRDLYPRKFPPRNLLWMEARDLRTGLDYRFICTHTWSQIDGGGTPRADREDRVDDTVRLIEALRDMAGRTAREGREVIVGGDFNVDWPDDRKVADARFPWVHLEKRRGESPRLQSHYTLDGGDQNTHGGRAIDYIYHWQRDGADRRRISQRSARTFFLPSDHRGVQAIFDTTVTT